MSSSVVLVPVCTEMLCTDQGLYESSLAAFTNRASCWVVGFVVMASLATEADSQSLLHCVFTSTGDKFGQMGRRDESRCGGWLKISSS